MSKKFYCLILAFVMLLAVSAVSAADDMNNASLTADDSTEAIAVDEIADDLAADSADDSDNLAADEKLNPNLDVNTTVDDYGNIGINITTEKNATGTVTINITNSSGLVMNDTGILTNGSYYLGDLGFRLPKDKYNITVFYHGDANYTSSTVNTTLTIDKEILNPGYSVMVIGKQVNATVNLGVNASGQVTVVSPTGSKRNITIENGKVVINETFDKEEGNLSFVLFYDGDANYYGLSEYPVNFFIKCDANLTVKSEVNKYGHIVIDASVNKNATGTITFIIYNSTGGEVFNVPKDIENGTASYDELAPFAKDNYTFKVIYSGDDIFANATSAIGEANVTKLPIDPKTTRIYVSGGEVNVTVDLGVNATDNVTVVYVPLGTEKNVTIVNGKVVINETFYHEQGNMSFVLSYEGDANYYGFYQYYVDFFIKYDSNLTVKSEVNEFGQIVIEATVNKTATGTITFIIKDSADKIVANVTKDIENGTASYDELTPFAKGNYTFEVIYSGDAIFETADYALGEANVTKNQVNITEDVKVTANQAEITINLGNATGNVTVYFLNYGSNQTFNITNGTVKIDQVFDNGAQSILVGYDGDANYYGFNKYIDFYVKASSFISATPVSVVYQNNGVVTVTLTDNNDNGTGKNPVAGVNVTVTLNGKQYVGVTNAKGIATITIPANLVPKAYTATVSYAGNATCNGDNNTFKFTVTKATPKITAKKKTFKAKKKVKKYSVVLKAGKNPVKNVKVTLKIKGKKAFTAKTNAKGKATFKITKLTKKGKYKAVIKSKANSYYKAAAKKKVKITIK